MKKIILLIGLLMLITFMRYNLPDMNENFMTIQCVIDNCHDNTIQNNVFETGSVLMMYDSNMIIENMYFKRGFVTYIWKNNQG